MIGEISAMIHEKPTMIEPISGMIDEPRIMIIEEPR